MWIVWYILGFKEDINLGREALNAKYFSLNSPPPKLNARQSMDFPIRFINGEVLETDFYSFLPEL